MENIDAPQDQQKSSDEIETSTDSTQDNSTVNQ